MRVFIRSKVWMFTFDVQLFRMLAKRILIISVLFCSARFTCVGQLFKLAKTVRDFSSNPSLMIAKPDEPILVQGNTDGSIIIRSAFTGEIQDQVPAHSKSINNFDFN